MAMDGASATKLFDKSRYRSHGTITGAAWATGLHGKALDFVGATPSYVEIAAAYDQLDFTSEDFSIIARIKADSLVIFPFVFTRGVYVVDGYEFYIRDAGNIRVRTNQASASQQTTSSAGGVVIGTWYTIGFSRSGEDVSLFIDGVEDTLTPGVHIDPKTSSRTAKIGIYDDKSSQALDGKIEFLRIFRGIALPASTHLAYHNALA